MPPIQETYGPVADKAVASYDFFDIQSGTGYTNYFGGFAGVSGAVVTILSNKEFYSNKVISGAGVYTSTSATSKQFDLDYDIQFRLPQTLRGTGIFTIPHGFISDGGTHSQYAVIKVRKWDGTTESEIAVFSGVNWSRVLTGVNEINTSLSTVSGTIPETNFGAGESLRITCEIFHSSLANQTGTEVFIGADPKGRLISTSDTSETGSTLTFAAGDVTTFVCQIPSKIDL